MLENYSDIEIKKWISDNKILFVTNSICQPGGTFLSSIRTYIDYIPVHNFIVIPGIRDNKPYYGLDVFLELTGLSLSERIYKKFDYIVYIDEDAFICDFKALMEEFCSFMKNDSYCLAGPQDGGIFCHRNHAHYMINTFLSFWNVKLLRQSSDAQEFIDMLNKIDADKRNSYQTFLNLLNEKSELREEVYTSADEMVDRVRKFREEKFPNGETAYSETVKNDPDNPIEPHQIPYSYKDYEEHTNFEPYYIIEQAYVLLTKKPIKYMFATDYYDSKLSDEETDNSGLTSAIYSNDDSHKLIAVHTWFARAYSRWPLVELHLVHTKRINKIIKRFGRL